MGYYNILGIEKKSTPAEIKAAYRAMAMEFHPDRLPRGTASEHEILAANEKFAAITSAHETLSHPGNRRVYDMNGPRTGKWACWRSCSILRKTKRRQKCLFTVVTHR